MLRSLKLLVLIAFAAPLYAQSPAAQAPSASITLRANSQLVVLDVVVTDKNQKPVHGLKNTDFAVLEASQPQAIRNFEEHTALAPWRFLSRGCKIFLPQPSRQ